MNSEYFEFLKTIINALARCHARYAIGGSFASSIYGEVRSTYDVDISIQLTTEQIPPFVKIFTDLGWYIFPEGVEKAVQQGGDFQVIDGSSGLKADFYVTSPTPSPRQQRTLERARLIPFHPEHEPAMFMSPEDIILYKLEWYMLSKSEKHVRDIGSILKTQGKNLDFSYIKTWLDEIEAREAWQVIADKYRKSNDEA